MMLREWSASSNIMTPTPLPTYKNPPVTEVVVSAQFEPLPKLAVPYLGLLWERFRGPYPRFEQHPPLSPVVERLGVRAPMNQVRIELTGGTAARLWFLNEAGDQLVQVQSDRFIRNWRRVPNIERPYPRFAEHVLPRFLEDYETFREFLRKEGIGDPMINQLEVSYINKIEMSEAWKTHAELSRMFRGWAAVDLSHHPVEAVQLAVSHLITSENGEFLGRLHVVLQSGFSSSEPGSPDDKPVFVLTLTARGKPVSPDDAGMRAFIEIAHTAIVSSFDKMTTEEAHRIWQKKPALTH